MSDIVSDPLYGAFYSLTVPARADQKAHIIAVTSPYSGSGTSHAARELGLLAAKYYVQYGLRVLLVDYDIDQQSQAAYFEDVQHQAKHGALSGPFDLTYNRDPFWQVSPEMVDESGNRIGAGAYGGAYLVGDSGLVISKFDWSRVKLGQNVHLVKSPSYWDQLRDIYGLIIVDTPAFDRSDNAQDVCAIADKSIIVSDLPRSQQAAIGGVSALIQQSGGHCAGLVVNDGPLGNVTPQATRLSPAPAPIA